MKTYNTAEYDYYLPEERIAKFPLENRSESKLLIYNKGRIESTQFKNIVDHLPKNCYLLFNDTKVIEARLHFFKSTGARIEIFLLQPTAPYTDIAQAMETWNNCTWKCTIGNKKKWKGDTLLQLSYQDGNIEHFLKARLCDPGSDDVEFTWDSEHSFAEVIHLVGKIPIPPYLHRENKEIDEERYQTVYSRHKGAVAAPTAGLHFTNQIIDGLKERNINIGYATLHVSAGTFKPVKTEDYRDHDMHTEQISVSRNLLGDIIKAKKLVCVGTTSLRILESLYWIGVKLWLKKPDPFYISKTDPYQLDGSKLPTPKEAIETILEYLESIDSPTMNGITQIFIYPGYDFKLCRGLVTNFHLPKSTLLLLISSYVGKDWRKIYEFAMANEYRFLSYGDTSLLFT